MNTEEVYVDPEVAYAAFEMVPKLNDTMPLIRRAATSALKKCMDDGRTPVMVEVLIRVAP